VIGDHPVEQLEKDSLLREIVFEYLVLVMQEVRSCGPHDRVLGRDQVAEKFVISCLPLMRDGRSLLTEMLGHFPQSGSVAARHDILFLGKKMGYRKPPVAVLTGSCNYQEKY
jgi:hypothetical protein